MMIVERRGKIIRTFLCCIMYYNSTLSTLQWYVHTYKQFLQLSVGLGLGLASCLCLCHFVLVFFAFIFRFSFFYTKPRDWLERTYPESSILCLMGRKTLIQSFSLCIVLWLHIYINLHTWRNSSVETKTLRYEFIPNYNRNILLTIIDVSTAAAAFFWMTVPD